MSVDESLDDRAENDPRERELDVMTASEGLRWMSNKVFTIELAFWLLIAVALLPVSGAWSGWEVVLTAPAEAAESPLVVQVQAGQSTEADRPESRATVTRGMGKEAVRHVWGTPEEVRKIRTCFGWQEEWVYRGGPERFGASERVLLFDEGEVLTEIK